MKRICVFCGSKFGFDDRYQQAAEELGRLLRSIDQPPLSASEEQLVFGPAGSPLSWRGFVDRLLLT